MEEELFAVLIPDGSVLKFAKKVQKDISKHYNLYHIDKFPTIHLTIDKVKTDYCQKTLEIMKSVVNNFKAVKIKINEFDCYYTQDNNFLVLKVERTESLKEFAMTFHQALANEGISLIENYQEWDFHITIVSNLFAKNPLSDDKFKELCYLYSGVNLPYISHAKSIELWRFTLNPAKKCIARFGL